MSPYLLYIHTFLQSDLCKTQLCSLSVIYFYSDLVWNCNLSLTPNLSVNPSRLHLWPSHPDSLCVTGATVWCITVGSMALLLTSTPFSNTGARRSRRWRQLAVWGMMSSSVLNGPTLLSDSSELRMCDFMLSHACSRSIPSSSQFSSPSVIYLITDKREGRKRIQVTVVFSLTPPLRLTLHRFHPLAQNSNLSRFFSPLSLCLFLS